MDVIIKRKPVTIPVLPLLAALVLTVLAVTAMRIGRVQGNEIGVLVDNLSGEITVRRTTGAFLYNGFLTDFYALDNTMQTIKMVGDDRVNIKSSDGADVHMDVEVNYRLVQDNVDVIADRVVPECGLGQLIELRDPTGTGRLVRESVDAYKGKWIRDFSRSVVRYTFGELETREFYVATRRDEKARESEDELNRLLMPHGIEVSKVVPGDFGFYAEYEKIIAEKKAADQEVQSQEELAKNALEEQKKKMTEANAAVAVEIATTKGELQKQILAAQADAAKAVKGAEAYAITTKKAADAAFYRATNEAQSVLAEHQAEAQGMQQLATSLSGEGGINLVKLEYAKALERARITGVPYATDPRIQKVEVSGSGNTTEKIGGGVR